jgi:hypothetical protein
MKKNEVRRTHWKLSGGIKPFSSIGQNDGSKETSIITYSKISSSTVKGLASKSTNRRLIQKKSTLSL